MLKNIHFDYILKALLTFFLFISHLLSNKSNIELFHIILIFSFHASLPFSKTEISKININIGQDPLLQINNKQKTSVFPQNTSIQKILEHDS